MVFLSVCFRGRDEQVLHAILLLFFVVVFVFIKRKIMEEKTKLFDSPFYKYFSCGVQYRSTFQSFSVNYNIKN